MRPVFGDDLERPRGREYRDGFRGGDRVSWFSGRLLGGAMVPMLRRRRGEVEDRRRFPEALPAQASANPGG
jgi:hypothetical protein